MLGNISRNFGLFSFETNKCNIMEKQYNKGTYSEWLSSLFGACMVAFGLGILLSEPMQFITWYIIIAGVILHGWGMYRMNKRNPKEQ